MTPTRVGKIARLPLHIREELNERLDDGQPGQALVEWLNAQPEVQRTLQDQFNSHPITEQNLSVWKQGGFQDWLRHQDACDLIQGLDEQGEELEEVAGDLPITDRFATLLSVEFIRVAQALLKESADPRERWRDLRELLHELGQFRRHDHRAARLRMDQVRWDRELDEFDREDRKREAAEDRQSACAPIWASLKAKALAPAFGGGETGRRTAEFLAEIQHGLPLGTLHTPPASQAVQPDPTPSSQSHPSGQSNPIQPNPT